MFLYYTLLLKLNSYMKNKYTFAFILLNCFILNVYCSIELRSKQMKTSDGLPSNSVRYMFQDSKGFLWLGTLDGLTRYDGNSFLTYQLETGVHDQISLADNRINYLTEDKNGFLWIGMVPELFSCYDLQKASFVDFTGNGKLEENYSNLYTASNGDIWLWHKGNGARKVTCKSDRTMTSVEFKTEHGNLPHNRIKFVNEDTSGNIWIGTTKGLVTIDKDNNPKTVNSRLDFIYSLDYNQKMYFLTKDEGIYQYNQRSGKLIHLDSLPKTSESKNYTGQLILKDQWIIFTSTGIYQFDLRTNKISTFDNLNIKNGRVIRDNRGNYWIYNRTGRVYYLLAETGEIKNFELIPEEKMKYIDHERYHIVHDDRDIIWISTYGNGLFTYTVAEGKLEHFVSTRNSTSPIGSDFLLYLMKDKTGGIWVSSEFSGLSHITVSNEGISRIFPESPDAFDRSNTIRLLTKTSNNNIWVGTRKGGLYKYDTHLDTRTEKEYVQYNIYAIEEDKKGKIWTGTRGEGLKIDNVWYKPVPSDTTTLSHKVIFSILRDRKDRMWIGTFGGGLNLAEPMADGKYKFRRFFQQKYGLRMVRVMAEDNNGMIWMGTGEGICIFHPDSLIANKDNYLLFNYSNGNFCSNEIRCIYRDSKGQMWIGTSGAGLNRCELTNDNKSLKYDHYGIAEGLVNNMVQSIMEDNSGQLWIATEYGISRFKPDSHSFENYYFSSYTLGNVYSENSACKGADGKLIFGTNYGLTVIDPQKISEQKSASPVVITNLFVNGTQISPETAGSPLKKSLPYTEEINLKYFQNSFLLDFSTLDFSDSGIKYAYWLENYDKTWNTPSSLSFASYKYLNPGTYTFHVKSCNSSGIWSESDTKLTIIVKPPFWKTNWAIFGYFIILLLILYFTYRTIRKISRLRNRIDVEKQLTEYKLVFFTNISHEFRTPLTLIQGAVEKIQGITDVPRELSHPLKIINKSTQRMLRLINQLLEFRKMQNNKLSLSLEETDVIAFIYEIFLSFGDVANQKKMNFRFSPSVPSYKMYVDKGNLDKVVYNLLSNAFKYTPSKGKIHLMTSIDEIKKLLLIQVSDTGVGIPKEKQGELFKRFMQSNFSGDSIGVGLHLSHELVTVHKGTIQYKENEGGGSVFTVSIPTDKSVYSEKDFLIEGNILMKEAEKHTNHLIASSDELPEPEKIMTPLNNRKVLIIEDDNDIREFLQKEIGIYFKVELATDGITGLEKARNHDVDLIICDVLMPGLTGFEVTKRLKSDFSTSHIPIILLTALSSSEKHMEGIEAGADAYITKPFSIKLLLSRAFRLIELREKLKEKFTNEPGIVHSAMCATDRDKEFVEQLSNVLEQNMDNSELSIDDFARLMKLGRTIFYKKLRGITGYSPNEYLRIMRMKKAAELLLSDSNLTVSEVAYMVGINNPFYFSRCFKIQFGVTPSAYKKGRNDDKEETKEDNDDDENNETN